MADMKRVWSDRKIGCGLLGGVFNRRIDKPTRPAVPRKATDKVDEVSLNAVTAERFTKPPEHNAKAPKRAKLDEQKTECQIVTGRPSDARRSSVSRNDQRKRFGDIGLMGNILVKQPSDEPRNRSPGSDPEVLKKMGNESYARGRFREALVFYEKAISLNPKAATYHCNKGAALIWLGRPIEASNECREALRLDPTYARAHQRLATLYHRLGEVDKALYHYKHGGKFNVNVEDPQRALELKQCLVRCKRARGSKEWSVLLDEARSAVSLGADSAPEVHAMQAEALLELHRHQDAHQTYQKGLKICTDSCSRFFGISVISYHLMIGARVSMAAGRFEEAVTTAQKAAWLDPSNGEVVSVLKRARAVASARVSGNLLYKASNFHQACKVYTEGLRHEANAVLLSNRAACWSKLGQLQKAVEDCNAALRLRPSYSKPMRRRADCSSKLREWKAAIQDYERLLKEEPDDEIHKMLSRAKFLLEKHEKEDIKDMTDKQNSGLRGL